MSDNLEIRGRLFLWHNAVVETQKLLILAKRSKAATEQKNILDEGEIYSKSLKDFASKKPGYTEGSINFSTIQEFDKQYKRPFPITTECFAMHQACVELAIVYFAQILNIGYEDTGKVAKNTPEFRNEHLNAIASQIFSNQDEINRFFAFHEEIRSARNQMIGHADGQSFNVKHGFPVSSHKMSREAWKDIDFEYWSSFLEPFRIKILEYANEITS